MEITDAIREYTFEKMSALEKLVPRDDTSGKLTVELLKTSNHHVNGDFFSGSWTYSYTRKRDVAHYNTR
jgi:ribosome-associated translation inhibitor RaiA